MADVSKQVVVEMDDDDVRNAIASWAIAKAEVISGAEADVEINRIDGRLMVYSATVVIIN